MIGEEYWITGVACSFVGFDVELKLNFGQGVNWVEEDEGCVWRCWKRREGVGGAGLTDLGVRNRCGVGVFLDQQSVRLKRDRALLLKAPWARFAMLTACLSKKNRKAWTEVMESRKAYLSLAVFN